LTLEAWLALAAGLLAGGIVGGLLSFRLLSPRLARLRTAARRVEQLDTARKHFIATASHELRTPIFSLGGFIELLEDDSLDPGTRRRFLGEISVQVERLRRLSGNLLDLSRLESGSLELRPESVDFGELTRSVATEFEPALATLDGHLELHVPRHFDWVCDPVRVAQIMRILIDNALSHNEPGLHIRLSASRLSGGMLIAVRDDGAGISPEALPRIFEPFFSADDRQGSGLGLAIAKELAEAMAGDLSVASAPGATTFELRLPTGATPGPG
jgi:two-component system, OmpR family, sensor kinase